MGQHYTQLSLCERIEIYRLHEAGQSGQAIATFLGRDRSTISRELKRNSRDTKVWREGYCAARAQVLAERRRRWEGRFKLARQPVLREQVRKRLAMGHSPEQIAGRLARDHGGHVISHESIYRFIYHRSAQKDYWHRLLPRRKSRRGPFRRRDASAASFIRDRRPLTERPLAAADRAEPGHWEGDFMLFARYGDNVLVALERQTCFLMACHPPDRKAQRTARCLAKMFARVPAALRKTLAVDNGTEFAEHWRLGQNIRTYFCDPHAPWQKGGVENAIGRLRRRLPRKTNLADISQRQFAAIVKAYNDTPRKCLGFITPAEAFSILKSNVALQT